MRPLTEKREDLIFRSAGVGRKKVYTFFARCLARPPDQYKFKSGSGVFEKFGVLAKTPKSAERNFYRELCYEQVWNETTGHGDCGRNQHVFRGKRYGDDGNVPDHQRKRRRRIESGQRFDYV